MIIQNRFFLALTLVSVFLVSIVVALAAHAQSDTDAYVEIEEADTQEVFDFAAVVRAGKSAVLSSQIEGLIDEVLLSEGDSFNEGDKLMSIDCTLPIAEHKKAKAQLRFLSQEHSNNVKLSKLDSISAVTLAKSALEVEKATVEAKTARYLTKHCDIHAPFSGYVVKWHVQQYENTPAKSQLLEIVNNDDLRIEFLLPSEHLNRLETKHVFSLYVQETGQSYPAEVRRVIPQVDSVSQTVKVVGQIVGNSEDLWTGMSGYARFTAFLDR